MTDEKCNAKGRAGDRCELPIGHEGQHRCSGTLRPEVKTYWNPAPAQSDAPSAEEWMRLQSLNGKRFMLTTQQNEIDGYMNVQQAMEAYAALRRAKMEERAKSAEWAHSQCATFLAKKSSECAQLERERDAAVEGRNFASSQFRQAIDLLDETNDKLTAAESALSEAREKAQKLEQDAEILLKLYPWTPAVESITDPVEREQYRKEHNAAAEVMMRMCNEGTT